MARATSGNANSNVLAEPVFWSPLLNILFVVDGRINTSKREDVFGLGYVLETLRGSNPFVRLNVEVVRRDIGAFVPLGLQDDNRYRANGGLPRTAFVFTPKSLDGWDQVWLFADFPANLADDHTEPRFSPLADVEVKALAEWMDQGGGVFAAGDHYNLGASMCSRIPRVRSMRRWTPAQGVPPQYGDARHETLQPNPSTGNPDVQEGDTYAQPIEVVQWSAAASDLSRFFFPHALLDTPGGPITTFPDHMHEGDVVPDDQVQLDNPLNITGYDKPEYPSASDGSPRPQPHVVAYGRTTNPRTPASSVVYARSAGGLAIDNPAFITERFALIGAYDGDTAGIGRVVVESTWHHWFSFNLHGFYQAALSQTSLLETGYGQTSQYALMQAYYRNVAIWLATPAQRQAMLAALAWRSIVFNTMAFPLAPSQSLWTVGERLHGAISETVSRSMLIDFVASIYSNRRQIFSAPGDVDPSAPYNGSVSVDLALRAILGGIAASLIKPAYDYVFAASRHPVDPLAIAKHFTDGVAQGHRALVDTINDRASMASKVVERLRHVFKPPSPFVSDRAPKT